MRARPLASVKESDLSGVQSPMLNEWVTIREPGFNCAVSLGRNFKFDAESR